MGGTHDVDLPAELVSKGLLHVQHLKVSPPASSPLSSQPLVSATGVDLQGENSTLHEQLV